MKIEDYINPIWLIIAFVVAMGYAMHSCQSQLHLRSDSSGTMVPSGKAKGQ